MPQVDVVPDNELGSATTYTVNAFATFLGCSLLAIVNLSAQIASTDVRLLGTAASRSNQLALLEFRNGTRAEVALLREGERLNDLEVTAIDAATGTVKILLGSQRDQKTLEIPVPNGVSKHPKLNLCNVDAATALAVLADACHVTVLARYEESSVRTNFFAAHDSDENGVFNVLTNGLAGCGITIIRDAEPFAFAIPTPLLGTFRLTAAPKSERKSSVSVIPAGMIRWVRADIAQACEFYGDLVDRSLVLISPQCFGTRISVQNMNSLTVAQAAWMFESLFQLNRMAVIQIGTNITIVAPFSQTNQLPRFVARQTGADSAVFPSVLRLQAASEKQLLQLYCDVTGGTAGIAAAPGRFHLTARKPMTRGEVKYALEATAALHGFTFQVNSDGKTDLVGETVENYKRRTVPR